VLRIELLNDFPFFVPNTDNHCSIHLRVVEMGIIYSAGISDSTAECELIKETVIGMTETDDTVSGLHLVDFSGTNVM
jgi:hypothetical protein